MIRSEKKDEDKCANISGVIRAGQQEKKRETEDRKVKRQYSRRINKKKHKKKTQIKIYSSPRKLQSKTTEQKDKHRIENKKKTKK